MKQTTIQENSTLKYPSRFSVCVEGLSEAEKKKYGVKEAVKIRGIGIVPTVSRNGIRYEMAEIANSWGQMEGEIITMNHTNDVTDAVAVINSAKVDETGRGWYEAIAYNTSKHPDAVQMIQRGLVKYVSIEANAGQLISENEETYIARQLEFTGLAFVRTAGIKETTVAIAEAFEGAIKKTTKIRGNKMAEENEPKPEGQPAVAPQAAPTDTQPEQTPKPEGEGEAKPEGDAKPEGEAEAEAKPEGEAAEKPEGEATPEPKEMSALKLTEELNSVKKKLQEMEKVQEEKIAEAIKKVIEKKAETLHTKPLAEGNSKQKMLENVDISNMSIADILSTKNN